MKVKVYRVWPKNKPELYYLTEAPFRWVAKWCGAALINNNYVTFLTAKDMTVRRFKEGVDYNYGN